MAGAYLSRVEWRAVFNFKDASGWEMFDSTIDFFVSLPGLVACRFAAGAVSGQRRGASTCAKRTAMGVLRLRAGVFEPGIFGSLIFVFCFGLFSWLDGEASGRQS